MFPEVGSIMIRYGKNITEDFLLNGHLLGAAHLRFLLGRHQAAERPLAADDFVTQEQEDLVVERNWKVFLNGLGRGLGSILFGSLR